ncbi:MAG: hypothetical protein J2P37_11605 [Ktedonobacteraceae bacterium]|nr:hypothetical protein [Ktedonobacteraceae bacterium]
MSTDKREVRVSRAPASSTARTAQAVSHSSRLTAWGIATVEAIMGYEWLLSALNKLLNARYVADFPRMLQQMASPENPNGWWDTFIHQQVLPSAPRWAILVEIGELGVALGFFAGALLWASGRFPDEGWTRWLNISIIVAIAAGVLMTVNYYLMAGHTLPWLNLADPFDEGLSLDGVLTGIGVGLFVLHVRAWWADHR